MMHILFLFDNLTLSHQPLGAGYLSSLLREQGHSISVINVDEENIFDRYREISPDILLFSTTSSHYLRYRALNLELKQIHPAFSLFGGHHPTFFPQMIEDEGIDAICIGEGEYPTLELITTMEQGGDYTHIHSLWFNQNGHIIKNPIRPFLTEQELNQLPFPDREVIRHQPIWKQRTGYVITGRGCPYDCSYCFNHVAKTVQEGRWVRKRSVDSVLAELKWLKERYKILYVAFQDDTFILNRRWLQEFLPRYRDEIGLPFMCNVRADLTRKDIVAQLADAGCLRVAMGIENGMDYLRREVLSKDVTTQQIQQACDLYYQHGIKTMGQNMIGVPGETVHSTLATLELNIRARTHINMFSFFQPYPGTRLGDLCTKENNFSGKLEEIPHEYQDQLAPSIRLKNREIIEDLGHAAHLFTSYPLLFWFTKAILPWLPTNALKHSYLRALVNLRNRLIQKGSIALPSIWHRPAFIEEAMHNTQPEVPIQPVSRPPLTSKES